jgi:hypothetical protein
MTQVVIDAEMLTKLSGLAEPLVFCDQHGRVLGRFLPDANADDLEPGISMEELRHRSENFEGRPLSDLLSRWEKGA